MNTIVATLVEGEHATFAHVTRITSSSSSSSSARRIRPFVRSLQRPINSENYAIKQHFVYKLVAKQLDTACHVL